MPLDVALSPEYIAERDQAIEERRKKEIAKANMKRLMSFLTENMDDLDDAEPVVPPRGDGDIGGYAEAGGHAKPDGHAEGGITESEGNAKGDAVDLDKPEPEVGPRVDGDAGADADVDGDADVDADGDADGDANGDANGDYDGDDEGSA